MPKPSTTARNLYVAYYTTISLLILGSFLDGYRAWGINALAYLPLAVTLLLLALLTVVPVLIAKLKWLAVDQGKESGETRPRSMYVVAGAILASLFAGCVFYLLRAKTHFLGDGYSLLANLGKWIPYQKPTELGTDIAVQWVARLVDVTSYELAERAYQIISIGSGMTLVAATICFGGIFFNRRQDKLSFTLLAVSGGQMLLFFGYVENYALLSVSSALFVLVGVGVVRGNLHRLTILLPLAAAVFFHLLGLVLLPAAVYLLLRDTNFGTRIGRLSAAAKWGMVAGTAIVATVALFLSGDRALFFQLTVVPLVAGKFTVRGYTLLSPSHILDFANLIFLLCPGILVCLAAIKRRSLKSLFAMREYAFLGIVTLSTLVASFLLDPKLGMARDWDLLSLAGFPLSVLTAFVLLDRNDRVGRSGIVLACVLGLAVLLSRAAVQFLPVSGAKYAEDVMKLDLARSRNAFTSLIDYYGSIGNQTKSAEINNYWQGAYPEVGALRQVSAMFAAGQLSQGKQTLDAVIARSPEYAEAWAGLCIYYYRIRQYDSALFAGRIANGLNPNNPAVLFNMGLAQYSLGNSDDAEQLWLKSLKIDSSFAALSLAHLYRDRGDSTQYATLLFSAASRSAAGPHELKEAIQLAIKRSQFDQGSRFLHRYREIVADSVWADSLLSQFPNLK